MIKKVKHHLKKVKHKHVFGVLVVALVVVVFLVITPFNSFADPIVNFYADPQCVSYGGNTNVIWSVQGAQECWVPLPSGWCDQYSSQWYGNKNPNGGSTPINNLNILPACFRLACKNDITDPGITFYHVAHVYPLNECSPPSINISANPSIISSGEDSILTWNVSGNATSCTASSNPSNPQWDSSTNPASSNGQHTKNITNITQTTTFLIFCSNASGSSPNVSVTVTVNSSPPPPPSSPPELAYWKDNTGYNIPSQNVVSPIYINDSKQIKDGSLLTSGLKVKGKALFNLVNSNPTMPDYSLKVNLTGFDSNGNSFGGYGGGNGSKYLLCCKADPNYPGLGQSLAYWGTITPQTGTTFGGWIDEGTRVALSSPSYHLKLGNYTSLYEGVNSSNRILFTSENGNDQIGNTFAGMFSGGNLDSGSFNNNTAIGFEALRKPGNTASFSGNTALGFKSMGNDNSGNYNTALGSRALYFNTSGNNNTGVGYKALYNNTTGNNNTALGYDAGPSVGFLTNTTAIGNEATVLTSDTMVFGNNEVLGWGFGMQPGDYAIRVYGSTGGAGARLTKVGVWEGPSDRSLKHDIVDLSYGLDEVMKLHPVDFKWNGTNTKDFGFIAQEVKEILPEIVSGKEGDMSITYSKFGPILVNAVKEQQAQLENDKIEIEKFEKQLILLEN